MPNSKRRSVAPVVPADRLRASYDRIIGSIPIGVNGSVKSSRAHVLVAVGLVTMLALCGCEGSNSQPDAVDEPIDGVEVAVLETSFGDITLGFLADVAPGHVDNFKKLIGEGFYDSTKFHRVVPRFMIQGGCPNTKEEDWRQYGSGNPGYAIPAEFNNTKHVRGTLSMARSQHPNSAGSQFFVCVARAASLDRKYTAFGFVVSGLDVVDQIVSVPTKNNSTGEKSLPVDPVHLKRAYIKKMPEGQVKPEDTV